MGPPESVLDTPPCRCRVTATAGTREAGVDRADAAGDLRGPPSGARRSSPGRGRRLTTGGHPGHRPYYFRSLMSFTLMPAVNSHVCGGR